MKSPKVSDDAPWIRVSADEVTIEVAARPRASRRGIVRASSDGLVIALTPAPDKGSANVQLIEYLARQLSRPPPPCIIFVVTPPPPKNIPIPTLHPLNHPPPT